MIRGLYASTSSLMTLLRRQEALSHNLANVNTPGFKQAIIPMSEAGEFLLARDPARGGDDAAIGSLPVGVAGGQLEIDYSQGPLANTGRNLDLAILGDGFFQLITPEGIRLTRDGTFHRDSEGRLCNADGFLLLGQDGPIQIDHESPAIVEDGNIYVPGSDQPAARIVLGRVADPAVLTADENGLLDPGEAQVELLPAAQTTMKQQFIEGANVDASATLVTMMMALRSYEAAQRTFTLQDRTLQSLLEVGRSV